MKKTFNFGKRPGQTWQFLHASRPRGRGQYPFSISLPILIQFRKKACEALRDAKNDSEDENFKSFSILGSMILGFRFRNLGHKQSSDLGIQEITMMLFDSLPQFNRAFDKIGNHVTLISQMDISDISTICDCICD